MSDYEMAMIRIAAMKYVSDVNVHEGTINTIKEFKKAVEEIIVFLTTGEWSK